MGAARLGVGPQSIQQIWNPRTEDGFCFPKNPAILNVRMTASQNALIPGFRPIDQSNEERPSLLVVVDTEEEFDWGADFDRANVGVEAIADLVRVQAVFDEFGIKPTYVMDYPVASQKAAFEPLKEIVDSGRATPGAHLHPWVSPPYDEEVNRPNSYPGNLPAELEREKLVRLAQTIEDNIGTRPTIYKAGRYGFGPNTARILEETGFEIDLSTCPPFDFSDDGGPDYSGFDSRPYWFGEKRRLLGLPASGSYVGFVRNRAHALYTAATHPSLRWARLPGILSRLRAVDRQFLSPEGYGSADHERLTRFLLASGVRTFTFSFHSPSMRPGCTPFVKNEGELREFLDACRRYFEFFLGDMNGVARTPHEVLEHLSTSSPAEPSRSN